MKTVLIVDDNQELAEIYSTRLKADGFNIVIASTAEEGFEQIKKSKPDLILLDIIMPGIKGTEFFLKLKENSETKDIKVIFMTAYASTATPWGEIATESYVKKIGAQGFLRKEMPLESFVEAIKKFILL
ncbi:MAG: response regulator [Patescibacteria group bacterium]